MMNDPYANYKRIQVETASAGRLLLMLYDGVLKNLRMAEAGIEQKNISHAHNCLIKAQNIVMELNMDLNMDAGIIAQNLRDLYIYIYKRLVEANLRKDAAIVREAIHLLSELKEAWEKIILKNKAGATP